MRTDDVVRELMPEEKVVWFGAPGKGIVTTWPGRRVRSVNLASLQEIGLAESRDGAGTLIFGSQTFATRGTPRSPRFEWIDDVYQVYQVAIAVQSGTDQRAAQQGVAADGLVGLAPAAERRYVGQTRDEAHVSRGAP